LHAELRLGGGLRVGKKRVARLMRELEIQGVSRRRGRVRTTTPDKRAAAAPDLVNRDFSAERPDETWVADITYLPTDEGWLFLAAVMDLYSRKIVGWSMREDLEAPLVVDAISMAIARRKPQPGLVHHSDRGSQYTWIAMVARCATRRSWPAWARRATMGQRLGGVHLDDQERARQASHLHRARRTPILGAQRRGSRRLEKPCQRKRGNLNLLSGSECAASDCPPGRSRRRRPLHRPAHREQGSPRAGPSAMRERRASRSGCAEQASHTCTT
jgi:transposase InsO family protein